jgi:xanthine dehydrogenase accessory factor
MISEILEKASEMLKNNIDLELVEIVESSGFGTPRKEGAFMFVDADCKSYGTVGGGNYEYKCTLYAKELLLEKKDGEKKYELNQEAAENIGMVCGGESTTKFTYLTNDEKSYNIIEELKKKNKSKCIVYIFGGGHVSTELKKILRYVGFEYVVWDDRIEFANAERFEDANKVICAPYENVLEKVNISENDFVVIMTRGHVYDYLVEKQVLKSNAYYIGVIGSKNKNKTIREKWI